MNDFVLTMTVSTMNVLLKTACVSIPFAVGCGNSFKRIPF